MAEVTTPKTITTNNGNEWMRIGENAYLVGSKQFNCIALIKTDDNGNITKMSTFDGQRRH